MADRNLAERHRLLAALTITGTTVTILLPVAYLSDPVKWLSMGTATLIFMLVAFGVALVVSIIASYAWIRKSRGKRTARKYLVIILLVLMLIFASGVYVVQKKNSLYDRINVNGVTRQYLLFIPTTYSAGKPMPLLVALHGGMGNAYQFMHETGFNSIAEKEGFIVVYPDGLGLLPDSYHMWNSGTIEPALKKGYQDVAFIEALIAHLESGYSINSSRIYIMGHSNGAMMAYRMAGEDSGAFAAVASVAGTVGGKPTPDSPLYTIPDPGSAVSVIEFHGLQDQNVRYNGGFPTSGFGVGERWDLSVNSTIHFWITGDKTRAIPLYDNSTNRLVSIQKYVSGTNDTQVTLVTYEEGDHYWNDLNSTTEQTYGISLSQFIWNDLSQYSR